MIKKAVITAAGLGTRLLPISKELPKEMMPLFFKGENCLLLKPLLQALFEQLYHVGFREFCIVIGRGKRAIEDHFTPDYTFLDELSQKRKSHLINVLQSFYDMIESSKILWINQSQPKGFGDAVLQAKSFISDDEFLVAAGDTYLPPCNGKGYLERLVEMHHHIGCDASFLVMDVLDPENHGIVEVSQEHTYLKVISVIEKPRKPKTNIGVIPFYIFKPSIFSFLEEVESGVGGEIQLTDAINNLIQAGLTVYALKLDEVYQRLDVGTPENYWEAIKYSKKAAENR